MGNAMSAAYRFAKRYDCMDMPEAVDPNAPHPADRAAGSTNGDSYDVSGTSSRDMVATLHETKSSIRDFDGKRFTRSYVLGKKVGESGRSEVFEATIRGSPTGSQLYSVKRTAREGLTNKDEKRLCEEVRILRVLQHSNVVYVHQFFKNEPKYYYVVMEHMAGGELFDRIVQKTYYNEAEVRDICLGLLESVRYCHELGIVHRDLRPENLLLSSKGEDANIKLAGFGFACSVLNGNVTAKCGSPGYVSPEVLRGLPYGTSVDMWSIGVIIYTLLGGYPPFHDENQTRLFRRIKAGSFRFHDEYWSDISAEAKDLIQRLLLVDVNKRLTATHAVEHPWLLRTGQELGQHDLWRNLEQLRIFNAIRKLRSGVRSDTSTPADGDTPFPQPVQMKPSPTPPNLHGQLPFDGKDFEKTYKLGDKIGSGAFSNVFLATVKVPGPNKGTQVAVKCVDRDGLPREDEEDLLQEVQILKSLKHPNVVDIYQFFQDDEKKYYVVIEFMKGGELFDRIVKKAYYNEKEARDLCRILLDAVKYIHDLGIVHRDLKPENLLLTSKHDDANIKLADFGFARSVQNGYVSTQCGTPGYVAPEILRGEAYGTSVDMWSIGVIIYILLGGYPPFHDENQTRLFRKIKAGNFKFHEEYWRSVSSDAKDLIKKLLTVDTKKRWTAAQAVSHPWLLSKEDDLISHNLGVNLEQLKLFNARCKLRAAIKSVLATQKLAGKFGVETWN